MRMPEQSPYRSGHIYVPPHHRAAAKERAGASPVYI